MRRSQLWGLTLAAGMMVFTGALSVNINSAAQLAAVTAAVEGGFVGTPVPVLTSLNLTSVAPGSSLIIYGTGFTPGAGYNVSFAGSGPYQILFGTTEVLAVRAKDSVSLAFTLPRNLEPGLYSLSVGAAAPKSASNPWSNPLSFSVVAGAKTTIPSVSILNASTVQIQTITPGADRTLGSFAVSSPEPVRADKISFKVALTNNNGKSIGVSYITNVRLYAVYGGATGLVAGPTSVKDGAITFGGTPFIMGTRGVVYVIKGDVEGTLVNDGAAILRISAQPYKDDWQIFRDDGGRTAVNLAKNAVQLVKTTIVKPSIKVISPNGGERLPLGSTTTIHWIAQGMPAEGKVAISLTNPTSSLLFENLVSYVSISPDQCRLGDDLGTCIDINAGSATIKLPDYLPTGKFGLKISCFKMNNHACSFSFAEGKSDSLFYITASSSAPLPSITLLSPNGGEKLVSGQTYNVKWRNLGISPHDLIRVTEMNSSGWSSSIGDRFYNTNNFNWNIDPDLPPGQYKLKVCVLLLPEIGCGSTVDESDSYFSIVAPPVIQHDTVPATGSRN